MAINNRRLVLVTGLPRSGTTVIGDVLATANATTSLYEPMNFQSGDKRFDASFPVCGSDNFSQSDFNKFVGDMQSLKLNLRLGLFPHDRGIKALAKIFTGGRSRMSYLKSRLARSAQTVIWKDPFALFCAEAAYDTPIDVAVAYRPPHAIAASYKRLNWFYDTQNLWSRLTQTAAGRKLAGESPTITKGISNAVQGAVFLWLASARMMSMMIDEGKPLTVVSTGHLPDKPHETMMTLFQHLNLSPSKKTTRVIEKRFTKRTNQNAVPSGHPHSQMRDLSSVNTYWKEVLSDAEAEYIHDHCSDLQSQIEPQMLGGQQG